MGLQLMNLHTVMGNVWQAECCSQMGTSLTSDKWTDHSSKEKRRERKTDLRENRMISHLISQTLIYRRFHKRESEGREIKLLHALIISYILY